MSIYDLARAVNNGASPNEYFKYLNETVQRSSDMEFQLEVHHAIAPMGVPATITYQCEGVYHSHPDTSWAECTPYVHTDGSANRPTIHMLCNACACSENPLGL